MGNLKIKYKRMEYIDNLERVKKTDEQIVERLMNDSKDHKFHWHKDSDYIYTKLMKVHEDTKIDIIFKISDQLEQLEIYSEYQNELQDDFDSIITLDIYMRKNGKKEIFCRRISALQLKLSNLLEIVLPMIENKIDKK